MRASGLKRAFWGVCVALTGCVAFSAAGTGPSAQGGLRIAGTTTTVDAARNPASGPIFGAVVDAAGRPVAGARVTAYLDTANPLIGNNSAGYTDIGTPAFFRISGVASAGSAQADSQGQFALAPDRAGVYNLEASLGDTLKAWKASVRWDGSAVNVDAGELALRPVGQISGRVRSDVAGVSNFTNSHVFVPGSNYNVITGPEGTFTLTGIPAGEFKLRAYHVDLGDAALPNADYPSLLAVEPEKTTTAPALVLTLAPPELEGIVRAATEPTDNGAPGAVVEIRGKRLGATRGTRISAQFTRSVPFTPDRRSDELVRLTVPPDAETGQVALTVGHLTAKALPFRVIASFSLDVATLSLRPGDAFDLGARLKAFDTDGIAIAASAAGATVRTYRANLDWSADSLRASVDSAGLVHAVSEGTVNITVSGGTLPQRLVTLTVSSGTSNPTPTPSPSPTPTQAASTGRLADDDTGDIAVTHDYVLQRQGVRNDFVWIPVFTAYQLLRPVAAGYSGEPEGFWVKDRPAAGSAGQDWAAETFGGFYAGKYEASWSDGTPGTPTDGSGATAGGSGTIHVQRYCVPMTNVSYDQAVSMTRAWHPNAHLLRDDEWTAMAVWAMIHGIRVYGNTDPDLASGAKDKPRDIERPDITFLDDPTFTGPPNNGINRALTGSGTASAWVAGQNETSHTGTSVGVMDLVGNIWEWTAGVTGAPPDGHYVVDGQAFDLAVTGGWIDRLATASVLRRQGVPGGMGSNPSSAFDSDWMYIFGNYDTRALRGGAFGTSVGAGLWAYNLTALSTGKNDGIGFRSALRFD